MNDRTDDALHRPTPTGIAGNGPTLSRRSVLQRTAAVAAGSMMAFHGGSATRTPAVAAATRAATASDDLHPRHAIPGILAALDRFPLVALGEYHRIQEMHDFITALLFHPALPSKITDIVVEFGNGAYQSLADRFVLGDQPVARADLVQIWRQNADPTFDAPVYEQVFRTVRAVNWMLPPSRRIRVLLGGPPVTMAQVLAHPTNHALAAALNTDITPLDTHYAAVVEREVLQKGRRALLIAGDGHLLRGLYAGHDTHTLNAATVLAQRHPGALFVIDLLLLPPGAPTDAAAQRLQASSRSGGEPSPMAISTATSSRGCATWRGCRAAMSGAASPVTAPARPSPRCSTTRPMG